jgi:hypothetical protein
MKANHLRFSYTELEALLLSYSCYKPAIPKIFTCLLHSGQYSCVLQLGWFRSHHLNVKRRFEEIGINFTATKVVVCGKELKESPLLGSAIGI